MEQGGKMFGRNGMDGRDGLDDEDELKGRAGRVSQEDGLSSVLSSEC